MSISVSLETLIKYVDSLSREDQELLLEHLNRIHSLHPQKVLPEFTKVQDALSQLESIQQLA